MVNHKIARRVFSFAMALAFVFTPVVTALPVQAAAPALLEGDVIVTPTNDNTPSWQFYSDQAGTVIYYGPCYGDLSTAVADFNTVTFSTLPDRAYAAGTKYACSVAVVNAAGEISAKLPVTDFTVDTTAPVLAVVTAVDTPEADTTPAFTFSSTEVGDTVYGGSCGGDDATAAVGNNAVNLAKVSTTATAMTNGTYSDCTITVTDAAGNASAALSVGTFEVQVPTLGIATITAHATIDSSATATLIPSHPGTLAVTAGVCAISEAEATITTAGQQDVQIDGFDQTETCTIQLTAASGATSNALALNAFMPTITDATAPDVTIDSEAVGSNGSTLEITVTMDEWADWAIDPTGVETCSAALDGQIGTVFPGSNVISIPQLADGTYADAGNGCGITFTDGQGNAATEIALTEFTILDATDPAATAPVAADLTTSEDPLKVDIDGVMELAFTSTEEVDAANVDLTGVGGCVTDGAPDPAFTITSNGGDILADDTNVLEIDMTLMADGTYPTCYFTFDDNAGNASANIKVPTFTIDTTGPDFDPVTSNASSGTNLIQATITSDEAGTVAAVGCTVNDGEAEFDVVAGTNVVTFDAFDDGAFTCALTPTDVYGTAAVAATDVDGTITATGNPVLTYATSGFDEEAMTLTFNSTEYGTLTYTGACSSKTNLSAVAGSNTIQFNPLPDGFEVEGCTVTLTDANGATGAITLPTFLASGIAGNMASDPVEVNAGYGATTDMYYVGDFDGDGIDDIMRATTADDANTTVENDLAWYFMEGSSTGVIADGVLWNDSFGVSTDNYYVTDMNGDGKADISISTDRVDVNKSVAGDLAWYLMVSNGTMFADGGQINDSFGVKGSPVTDWYYPADFNGDGKTDLLVSTDRVDTNTAVDGDLAWYLMVSNGSTYLDGGQIEPSYGLAVDGYYVMDYNNDGKDDLLVGTSRVDTDSDAATTNWSWYVMQNNGTNFVDGGPGSVGEVDVTSYAAFEVKTGDMNNDGKDDVVLAATTDVTLEYDWMLYANTGAGFLANASATYYNNFGLPTDVILVGQFDGQKGIDIVTATDNAGTYVWNGIFGL